MILPIKYGGLAKTPVNIGEFLVRCPSCESNQWADVMVLSNYWYFLFVPMYPMGKEANILCKKCGLKRYGGSFDASLISNYEEIKKHYRHPWFTYIGISIIILVILLAIIFSII